MNNLKGNQMHNNSGQDATNKKLNGKLSEDRTSQSQATTKKITIGRTSQNTEPHTRQQLPSSHSASISDYETTMSDRTSKQLRDQDNEVLKLLQSRRERLASGTGNSAQAVQTPQQTNSVIVTTKVGNINDIQIVTTSSNSNLPVRAETIVSPNTTLSNAQSHLNLPVLSTSKQSKSPHLDTDYLIELEKIQKSQQLQSQKHASRKREQKSHSISESNYLKIIGETHGSNTRGFIGESTLTSRLREHEKNRESPSNIIPNKTLSSQYLSGKIITDTTLISPTTQSLSKENLFKKQLAMLTKNSNNHTNLIGADMIPGLGSSQSNVLNTTRDSRSLSQIQTDLELSKSVDLSGNNDVFMVQNNISSSLNNSIANLTSNAGKIGMSSSGHQLSNNLELLNREVITNERIIHEQQHHHSRSTHNSGGNQGINGIMSSSTPNIETSNIGINGLSERDLEKLAVGDSINNINNEQLLWQLKMKNDKKISELIDRQSGNTAASENIYLPNSSGNENLPKNMQQALNGIMGTVNQLSSNVPGPSGASHGGQSQRLEDMNNAISLQIGALKSSSKSNTNNILGEDFYEKSTTNFKQPLSLEPDSLTNNDKESSYNIKLYEEYLIKEKKDVFGYTLDVNKLFTNFNVGSRVFADMQGQYQEQCNNLMILAQHLCKYAKMIFFKTKSSDFTIYTHFTTRTHAWICYKNIIIHLFFFFSL